MFKKSSFCFGGIGCVEARIEKKKVLMHNSKKPEVSLSFSLEDWRAFIAGVKAGEVDLPK